MATTRKLNTGNEVHFVTLKLTNSLKSNKTIELFNDRVFCDAFIKALIYCIEKYQMIVYGFVILSDQIHLIIRAPHDDLQELIKQLMSNSEKEILHTVGKKISMLKDVKSKEEKDLRRFFSQLMNADILSLWHSEHHLITLSKHQEGSKLTPLDADVLIEHLSDKERNYLQLGADAFTRLMMDSMKL